MDKSTEPDVVQGDNATLLLLRRAPEHHLKRDGRILTKTTLKASAISGVFETKTKFRNEDGSLYELRKTGGEEPPLSLAPDTFLWLKVGPDRWELVGQVHTIERHTT